MSVHPDDNFVICLDVEGTLCPEAWLALQQKTQLEELKITTAHEPDYDKLMQFRLDVLKKNNITLQDMKDVVDGLPPLEGAVDFLEWMSELCPRILLLTDTFENYAIPMFEKMNLPCVFCHSLAIDKETNFIESHTLRLRDQKRKTVEALQRMNFRCIAIGDSFNDISMLTAAEKGILYAPPPKVINAHPNFARVQNYAELKNVVGRYLMGNRRISPRAPPAAPDAPTPAESRTVLLLLINVADIIAPSPWSTIGAELQLGDTASPETIASYCRENKIGMDQLSTILQEKFVSYSTSKGLCEKLRALVPRVFLITDLFEEYANVVFDQVGQNMLLNNYATVDADSGAYTGIKPRCGDSVHAPKERAVEEFQNLNFRVVAVGSASSDQGMLAKADVPVVYEGGPAGSGVLPEFTQHRISTQDDLLKLVQSLVP